VLFRDLAMRDVLFTLDPDGGETLHTQLRRQIVTAIGAGHLPGGSRMPSTRRLAESLSVSRNTVIATYAELAAQGYLVATDRSGYRVAADRAHLPAPVPDDEPAAVVPIDWEARFTIRASGLPYLAPPRPWQSYPYPFVYGQADHSLFPLAAWRDCSRRALGRSPVDIWTADGGADDDPDLVDQLRTLVLPRRGIRAAENEILITLGAQQALFLLAFLLFRETTVVGVEEPGYADARAIFSVRSKRLRSLAVDDAGLVVDDRLDGCEYVYITPSHQMPTTVAMTMPRRMALLERAESSDIVVIEDDYESDSNPYGVAAPAIKSLDRFGRVIYVGTFSNSIAPGLRIGYIVGPAALVAELRHVRRLILRHPPANNQRTLALFLAGGHYDGLLARLNRVYRGRREALADALDAHLPSWTRKPTHGGVSFWLSAPEHVDTGELALQALERGVIMDPGALRYFEPDPPRRHARLGFSAIDESRIEPGIRVLAELFRRYRPGRGTG